jgi:hypothetical protein
MAAFKRQGVAVGYNATRMGTTVGLDLAKHVFQVHGTDAATS